MPHIAVAKEVGAPAWRIWELLSDFADVSWIPVTTQVDTDGEGIGMRRFIHGSGDQPVVETLTHVRAQRREIGYTVAGSPLPVSRFEAVVNVEEGEHPHDSVLTWHVDYDPCGPQEEAEEAIRTVYTLMAGWLADAAAQDRP
ncbi:SRPBCC family protein [Mycobacterium sp. SMC-4]|uniref:SRPBCC family protein n=1 Tax=Mycobacterium sp. SMC-4 TaxID=2857059 RepID=UPI0021B2926C|nr:SRPBCC family protein [Mycobacterium sp. SMC-4]UXA19257.1 SRPBCC family protein [Mycobacterium sp. SMC-4]